MFRFYFNKIEKIKLKNLYIIDAKNLEDKGNYLDSKFNEFNSFNTNLYSKYSNKLL